MNDPPESILRFLDEHCIAFERTDHPAVFTVEQANELVPPLSGAKTKNLFLRDNKGKKHFLVVLPSEKSADLKALSHALGVKKLGFASPERLLRFLGIEAGAVSILAVMNDRESKVGVVVDRAIWNAEAWQCHPLVNTSTLVIAGGGIRTFLEATGHEAQVIDVPGRKPSGESAKDYDRQAAEWKWVGPDIVFGLMAGFVGPGEKLLDIGTGTGLASVPFLKAGLEVHGIDVSEEMLQAVRTKGLPIALKRADVANPPLPYPAGGFDHVLALGLLHFFRDLDGLFAEAARLLRPGGLFAFTVETPPPSAVGEVSQRVDEEWGVTVFGHGKKYLYRLFDSHGFNELESLEFIGVKDPRTGQDLPSDAYVVRKG